MSEKKQIRCINCNNIIANGYIKEGVVEIDCRHCKTKNRMEAVVQPYGERRMLMTKDYLKELEEHRNRGW